MLWFIKENLHNNTNLHKSAEKCHKCRFFHSFRLLWLLMVARHLTFWDFSCWVFLSFVTKLYIDIHISAYVANSKPGRIQNMPDVGQNVGFCQVSLPPRLTENAVLFALLFSWGHFLFFFPLLLSSTCKTARLGIFSMMAMGKKFAYLIISKFMKACQRGFTTPEIRCQYIPELLQNNIFIKLQCEEVMVLAAVISFMCGFYSFIDIKVIQCCTFTQPFTLFTLVRYFVQFQSVSLL